MNKDQGINILLEYAKRKNDPSYKVNVDDLTAAVLVVERYLKEKKEDNKIDITGLQFNLIKGI
tara:strand:+ start:301 stop:489 length:189 start_codon:yes stop_codon:yes gene_type:complete